MLAIRFDEMPRTGEASDTIELARRGHVTQPRMSQIMALMDTLKGYRDHLHEIDEELEEASSFNDPTRHEKLSDERQAILDQIKSAQGLGGRVRQKFYA